MEDALKSALLPLMALFVLNSCAWYRDVERSLVDDDEKTAKKTRPVTREQYDQLLVKYEELSKKYEKLKESVLRLIRMNRKSRVHSVLINEVRFFFEIKTK